MYENTNIKTVSQSFVYSDKTYFPYLLQGMSPPCSIFPPTTLGGSDEGVYNCTLHIVPQLPSSHIDSAQRCLRIRVIAGYWGAYIYY